MKFFVINSKPLKHVFLNAILIIFIRSIVSYKVRRKLKTTWLIVLPDYTNGVKSFE